MNYIIASNRPFKGRVASNPEELNRLLTTYEPEVPLYIFFPFWSWKVPDKLLQATTCIGFHSAPLPKGKGGSPIQNMIRLGYGYTEVCAFKMTTNFDEGEIILRHPISLGGSLGNIVKRISELVEVMIDDIVKCNTELLGRQEWEIKALKHDKLKDRDEYFKNVPDTFKRITDNLLLETDTIKQLHDEIRMRDEEGHPKTYLWHGRYKIDFTNARLEGNKVMANVEIYNA